MVCSPTVHPGESFTKLVFSKEFNDTFCRIGKTVRQAPNVHPNLISAIAQKMQSIASSPPQKKKKIKQNKHHGSCRYYASCWLPHKALVIP